MTRSEKMVTALGLLKFGKDSSTSFDEFRDAMGSHSSVADVKLAMTDLIYNKGVPIGNSIEGLYIIETDDECEECVSRLVAKANGLLKKAEKIRKNYEASKS